MSVTRRKFLRTAALGSATLSLSANTALRAQQAPTVTPKGLAQPPRRPNLLFLWTDQHRGDTVPWAGNPVVQAPHFFRPLGERSFIFERTYVTQPVCTPSRGSIMTGLWPHNHGSITNNLNLRSDCRTIAEYLPDDYATAHYGKWHLGDENKAQHGFRDWRSIEDIYRDYYTDPEDLKKFSDYHNFLVARGFPPDREPERPGSGAVFSRLMAAALPEPYTKVAFLAGEAEQFLHARRDGQPFILSVNSLEPHPPTYGPLNERHDPNAVPAGPAFAQPLGPDAPAVARGQAEKNRRVPTLLDLMGIDVSGQVDGRSRTETLRSPRTWREENVSVEWNDPGQPATDGRSRVTADGWKLNLYRDDRPELYHLISDPGERVNRAQEPAQRERVRRLTDELHAWQQQTHDTLPLRT
jgi:arylsulfatase A-like enzyme